VSLCLTKFSKLSIPCSKPRIQWKPGAILRRVKRPGRESDHSSLSSGEVKMRGAIHSVSIA
jgi:hypothetical protein